MRDTMMLKFPGGAAGGATSGNAAQYPTGPISPGGANVDEIDLRRAEVIGRDLVWEVNVLSMGTNTSIATILQEDSDPAFGTARTAITWPAITVVGPYPRRYSGSSKRYYRFQVTPTGGDSSIIECACRLAGDSFRDV
ncbi:MAG TPA: hypothetical protein VE911_11560 [Candidatus Nitrosopolaris sp.]|nr:hypothetical protein [Candidatus Nitrosopolaris sp.]